MSVPVALPWGLYSQLLSLRLHIFLVGLYPFCTRLNASDIRLETLDVKLPQPAVEAVEPFVKSSPDSGGVRTGQCARNKVLNEIGQGFRLYTFGFSNPDLP